MYIFHIAAVVPQLYSVHSQGKEYLTLCRRCLELNTIVLLACIITMITACRQLVCQTFRETERQISEIKMNVSDGNMNGGMDG